MCSLSSFINLALPALPDSRHQQFGSSFWLSHTVSRDQVNDFVNAVFLKAEVLQEKVVLDILLDDFLVNPVASFISFPFLSGGEASKNYPPSTSQGEGFREGKEWNR